MAVFTGNGSAASPSLTFSSDTDLGFYRVGVDTLSATAGGSEQLQVGTAYLRLLNNGIQFNGDTAAANALDDYEEGTWTMEARDDFSGGNQGSFAIEDGHYTKIGNKVTVYGRFVNCDTSGMTGTSDFYVAGLPFAASSSITAMYVSGDINPADITFSGQLGIRLDGSRAAFRLMEVLSGTGQDYVQVNELASGTADAAFTLTYFV